MSSILFSILLSFSAVPATTAAEAEPLIVRSQVHDGEVALLLANLQRARVTVQIHDLDLDQKVFSHVIKNHNGYSYSLGFDELPEGRYLLSVRKGDTLRQQVVLKTEAGIMCSAWK